MIDPRLLRDDPDRVRAAQAKRGLSADVVDRALAADEARRAAIAEFEAMRAEQKQLGKQIPQAQGDEKAGLLARTKALAAEVKAAEAAQAEAEEAWQRGAHGDPQPRRRRRRPPAARTTSSCSRRSARRATSPPRASSRATTSSSASCSAPSTSSAAPRCPARASTTSPASAPQLELALVNLAMDQARDAGFTPVIPPALVKPRAMEGTGFLGQAAEDVYRLEGQDLYLVGTSEVPLAAYHSDEILDAESLPLRYAAFSPCFRREAGSHGKDTRGIIRVHWFDKVEMFVYTTARGRRTPSTSGCWRGRRSSSTSSSSPTGSSTSPPATSACRRSASSTARRGSRPRASYRELTSTSNCTEFQARRLDIRGRFATRRRHRSRWPR